MQILVLILGTVLLSKACALKCYQCTQDIFGNCNQTKTVCPSSTQCGSVRSISYAGGSIYSNVKGKSCATTEDCYNTSFNLGVAKTVYTSSCCSSDLCNTQDAPDGGASSPNGKKCFQCDGQDCTKTLSCNGIEDYCLKVTTAGVTVKGCASEVICSSKQIAQLIGVGGGVINCCQGNLCNSVSSTTAGLLLLVALLICLTWFS